MPLYNKDKNERVKMQIDETILRNAMKRWTTGVTVVTSIDKGIIHGMTVSSFTSVSVTPPVVCISVNQLARTHQMIENSGVFGVSILEESQGALSDCFAGRIPEEGDQFSGVETFKLETGAPLLTGGIAFFDCKVINKLKFGNNTVFFGAVVAVQHEETHNPLLYSNRSYQSLQK